MSLKSARKAVPTAPYAGPSPTTMPRTAQHADAPPSEPPLEAPPLNFHTNFDFWQGRKLSFAAALAGLAYVVRTQPNVWIELAALSVVAIAGLFFGIGALEWGLLGLTVTLILALEAVNTAVETVVDLVSPHYHPLAKIAKDTAAGALVIAVLGSVVVAASIFGPRLWVMLFG